MLRAFLYRRLARWITCEVRLLGQHPFALDSKFQVNSLQDVFFHPFYWQLYSWLPAVPRLVVDLGAHCAHFSMLADLCFRARFGNVESDYVLIEPNPRLIPIIARNLKRSGLCPRNRVYQGLVGASRAGCGTLWVHPKNYLSAGLTRAPSTRGIQAPYLDLETVVGSRAIDLLKVDIEGAEFDFVENYRELLGRVGTLVIEIHGAPEGREASLYHRLVEAGLRPWAEPLKREACSLAMFRRGQGDTDGA